MIWRYPMKTMFYCVIAEFYDNYDEDGTFLFQEVKACIITSEKHGHTHYRQTPGMTAFRWWWGVESYATGMLASIKSGKIDGETMLSLISEYQDWENEVYFKGAAA
jgi:hypothetical protein